MSGIRSRGLTLVALAAGAAPGLLLPVVVTWRLPLISAAALLLALTLTQIAYAALGAPYETTLLVRLGKLYGSGTDASRLPLRRLALQAIVRAGPTLLVGSALLVAGAGLVSPDTETGELALLAVPFALSLLVQVASTPLSAHLYAVRRLPSVYFGAFFLGGPSLAAALLWTNPLVVASSFLVGQCARWLYLAWRARASERNVTGTSAGIASPTWSELAPQVFSSVAGQLMPVLVQALLAASGAGAVAAGAVAYRIWGAASQVGTSTVAMPEVVTLTRDFFRIDPRHRGSWIDRHGLRLVLVSVAMALLGGALIAGLAAATTGALPDTVTTGLWWSLVVLIAFPFSMLNFWAGRGLIAIRATWWLPVLILLAFVVGGATIAVTVPAFGAIGALVGFVAGFVVQAAGAYAVFRRLAPRTGSSGGPAGEVPGEQ